MNLHIHIGSHKAGSSAIQRAAYQHANDLLAQNFLYPVDLLREHPRQHSGLAKLARANKIEEVEAFFAEAQRMARSHGVDNILISGEGLCAIDASHIDKLPKIVDKFRNIHIIYIVRNWREYLLSQLRHQLVFQSGQFDLLAFVRQMKYHDYNRIVENWETAFGRENVDVLGYENIKFNLLETFFAQIGVRIQSDWNQDTVNRSIDLQTSIFFNELKDSFDRTQIRAFSALYEEIFPNGTAESRFAYQLVELISELTITQFKHLKLLDLNLEGPVARDVGDRDVLERIESLEAFYSRLRDVAAGDTHASRVDQAK